MKNTALITGASSGIGRELARIHAKRGGDLVVVARRLEALESLKSELEHEYGISALCIAADLTAENAAQFVFAQVQENGILIDILINNAGFGGHGKFHERDVMLETSMIQLNVSVLTELTHLFVQGMVARKRGKVLNVASTAAFLPGPLQAVYYATKAYVFSFSQALAEELRSDGVTVTALCPGPVATEFTATADLENVAAFKNTATPEDVAEIGYRAMTQGKLVVIDDWKLSFLLNWIVPWLPRRLVLKLSRQSMEKQ